jgi:nitroreductase
MELIDTLRTTGAVREYLDEPVSDDVVYRMLDAARFAPNGGNRQAWRVVVVRDRDLRTKLRDCYVDAWPEYLAQARAGLVPWAPLNDRDAEARALEDVPAMAARLAGDVDAFANRLDEAPVLLTIFASLGHLAAVDRDADRYTFAGGGSIYPFVWSLLLAARAEGLGGVITTIAVRRESAVRELFDVPDTYALAAVVALGRPRQEIRRLRRAPVESFATVDRFTGAPLSAPA